MSPPESLKHAKWECKHHAVWIPNYRKKSLHQGLGRYLGELLKGLAAQKECKILAGHWVPDHVHILLSIPPKYSVPPSGRLHYGQKCNSYSSQLYGAKEKFAGQSFWARGYYFSTVGKDEEAVRECIKHQEEEDRRIEQLNLFWSVAIL